MKTHSTRGSPMGTRDTKGTDLHHVLNSRQGSPMKKVLMALSAFPVVLLASPAFAHGKLQASTPKDGSTLEQAPKLVRLQFNEPVEATRGRPWPDWTHLVLVGLWAGSHRQRAACSRRSGHHFQTSSSFAVARNISARSEAKGGRSCCAQHAARLARDGGWRPPRPLSGIPHRPGGERDRLRELSESRRISLRHDTTPSPMTERQKLRRLALSRWDSDVSV